MKDINKINSKNLSEDKNSININIYDEQFKNLERAEEEEINYDNDNLEWKEYHENILVDWADKALCYRWLHSKSSTKYIKFSNSFT